MVSGWQRPFLITLWVTYHFVSIMVKRKGDARFPIRGQSWKLHRRPHPCDPYKIGIVTPSTRVHPQPNDLYWLDLLKRIALG